MENAENRENEASSSNCNPPQLRADRPAREVKRRVGNLFDPNIEDTTSESDKENFDASMVQEMYVKPNSNRYLFNSDDESDDETLETPERKKYPDLNPFKTITPDGAPASMSFFNPTIQSTPIAASSERQSTAPEKNLKQQSHMFPMLPSGNIATTSTRVGTPVMTAAASRVQMKKRIEAMNLPRAPLASVSDSEEQESPHVVEQQQVPAQTPKSQHPLGFKVVKNIVKPPPGQKKSSSQEVQQPVQTEPVIIERSHSQQAPTQASSIAPATESNAAQSQLDPAKIHAMSLLGLQPVLDTSVATQAPVEIEVESPVVQQPATASRPKSNRTDNTVVSISAEIEEESQIVSTVDDSSITQEGPDSEIVSQKSADVPKPSQKSSLVDYSDSEDSDVEREVFAAPIVAKESIVTGRAASKRQSDGTSTSNEAAKRQKISMKEVEQVAVENEVIDEEVQQFEEEIVDAAEAEVAVVRRAEKRPNTQPVPVKGRKKIRMLVDSDEDDDEDVQQVEEEIADAAEEDGENSRSNSRYGFRKPKPYAPYFLFSEQMRNSFKLKAVIPDMNDTDGKKCRKLLRDNKINPSAIIQDKDYAIDQFTPDSVKLKAAKQLVKERKGKLGKFVKHKHENKQKAAPLISNANDTPKQIFSLAKGETTTFDIKHPAKLVVFNGQVTFKTDKEKAWKKLTKGKQHIFEDDANVVAKNELKEGSVFAIFVD